MKTGLQGASSLERKPQKKCQWLWRLYEMDVERPVFTTRIVQLHPRFKQKNHKGSKKIRLLPKREDTREGDGKGETKEKGPKGTSP